MACALSWIVAAIFILAGTGQGEEWRSKDNRLRGKTQQIRPIEPQEPFITKRAKV